MGKTPIDHIEEPTRQSKYSRDDTEKDPYPWLWMTMILGDRRQTNGDLKVQQTCLKPVSQKHKSMLCKKILLKYRAFSLSDEIGLCPNMEVNRN